MFVELRAKTHYSFLRAVNSPAELIFQAARLGQSHIGLTDYNGVFGLPKAWQCIKKNNLPVKLLSGAELIFEDAPSISLLAKNRAGYGLMCRLLTRAHEGKEKGKGALSWAIFCEWLSDSSRPWDGLIALPSLNNPMCPLPAEKVQPDFYPVLKQGFKNIFLPLARLSDGFDEERTRQAVEIQKKYGLELVASQEVLFLNSEQKKRHDVLTSIREGKALKDIGRLIESNAEKTLKSEIEIHTLFRDLPEAVLRTQDIAESCSFDLSELKYRYPTEWIAEGHTAQSFLVELTFKGARSRYGLKIPQDVHRQIVYELGLIQELKFADYFLTIWDIVEFARARGILCQGRGSAANSAVCYCLGITAIDPVRMNLLFERFISVERGEPPDIDVDFESARREEVLQYVYQKYGRERAAMVSAVVTYQKKMARNECQKAFAGLGSRADGSAATIQTETEQLIEQISEEMIQTPRHLSIHSGGFTLSADPMVELVPIEPARMKDRTIIQWDKYDLDILGLLKVDLLSLGMLTALKESLELTGLKDLARIPADDAATYKMIQAADTIGVFQIESRAQMSMLPRLLPANFYDLVVELAIVRPGPIVGKMVHPFLRRRRGLEPITMPHPKLEPILGRTLGVPIFQEQVMKMAIVLAGFTPGEADELRRAIGAWRSSGDIYRVGLKLQEGLIKSGLPVSFVEQIFEQIKGFAEYGFPESHSASFALLAYASSYLKCHHPAEFTCSLLNAQPMGFYSCNTLIEDAKRHGVRILGVDVHASSYRSTIEIEKEGLARRCLRLGLNQIKGLHQKQADEIIRLRPYEGVRDFVLRTHLKRDVLERLAMGDFFESFGQGARATLWEVLKTYTEQNTIFERPVRALGLDTEQAQFGFLDLSPEQELQASFRAYGVSPNVHPMEVLRARYPEAQFSQTQWRTAKSIREPTQIKNERVSIAGWVIVRQRPPTAKGMCFATLEDETGFIDIVLRPNIFEEYGEILKYSALVLAHGHVQRDGGAVSVLVSSLGSLSPILNRSATSGHA